MIDPHTGEESFVRGPSRLAIALRRWWFVIVVVAAVGAVLGYAGSKLVAKTYSATGDTFVSLTGSAANVSDLSIQTVAHLITSDAVLRRVAADTGQSLQQVQGHVSATPVSGSSIVAITTTARSPRGAAALANSVYTAFRGVATDPGPSNAVLNGATTYFASPQPPTAPSSPHPARNAGIALVLGVILALGAVWLREIRWPTAADAALAAGTLSVPLFADLATRARRETSRHRAVTALALDLDELAPRGTRVLALGAVRPDDLGPALPLALAQAFSEGSWRVILVDGDTRGGAVTAAQGFEQAKGLTDVVGTRTEVASVLRPVRPQLSVVPVGKRGLSRAEQNLSAELRRVLDELKLLTDLAIVAVPGLGQDAEARLLAAQADAVIIVVTPTTPIAALAAARERLELFHARVIGIVRDEGHSAWQWRWRFRRTAPPLPEPTVPGTAPDARRAVGLGTRSSPAVDRHATVDAGPPSANDRPPAGEWALGTDTETTRQPQP